MRRPCLRALRRLQALPRAVFGPVDFLAFSRFARRRASESFGLGWLVGAASLLSRTWLLPLLLLVSGLGCRRLSDASVR